MKTTIELSDPLLERAKRLAARDSTSLRELVEAGLRHVLKERSGRNERFVLRDARVNGSGLSQEFADAGWDEIRNASYAGRGA
ncbi:MAG: type II toxin-antitoxin system VapB family antitoxin [Deltaproteobacteria bacterium]